MEMCALPLQDLDELQLSHLWHFNVRMTSAASEGDVQSGEKLRFVFLTFWTSADCNKLELDELECVIKAEAGEQESWGEEPVWDGGRLLWEDQDTQRRPGSGEALVLDVLVPLRAP